MQTNSLLFVSHSHEDDPFCLRLIADLRANLGDEAVWYDTSGGLHGGDDWWDRIIAEITARPYFLVVLSPNASASKWVPQEMAMAFRQHVELGKRLLPVRLADSLRREDWRGIQEFDFTQASDHERYAAALAEVLRFIDPKLTTPVIGATPVSPALTAPERPLSPTERLAQETHTAYAREHWSDVLDKTEILVERGAMTPALWRERASAAFALGDNNGGLAVLKQALKAGVDDADTLLLYARLTAKAGDDNQAVEILTRAYALVSLDDTATRLIILDELIAMLAHLGRWDDFARRVSDGRRMAPDDPRWALRSVEALLGQKRYDEAVAAARALPGDIDAAPLLQAWHTAIDAAMDWTPRDIYGTRTANTNWNVRSALLNAAPSIGANPATITRWRRFDFAHFVPLLTLSHSNGVDDVAWASNSMRLATACGDGTAKIWDAATGRLIATLPGYSQHVSDVAWSPDGARIAVAGDDETILIWDATNERLLETFPSKSRGLLATSNNARRLLQTINGYLPDVFNGYYPGYKREVAWSPDGSLLATFSGKLGTLGVQVWDVASGRLLTLSGNESHAHADAVTWSPDGAYLAVSSGERTQIWKVASGRFLLSSGNEDYTNAGRVAWSPDGMRLATSGERGTRVWDTASKRLLTTLAIHPNGVGSLAWAPDGNRLATGGHEVNVWDATSGRLLTNLYDDSAHSRSASSGVGAVAWSPDGTRLATAVEGVVAIWGEE